jgi:hypothetical protein|eukprot:COSAG06_NODE_6660_length_2837_cov_89.582177_5_plen_63_part_00
MGGRPVLSAHLNVETGVRTCCSGEGGIGSGEEVGDAPPVPLPAPFNVKCDYLIDSNWVVAPF